MKRSRRDVLASVAGVALAGCADLIARTSDPSTHDTPLATPVNSVASTAPVSGLPIRGLPKTRDEIVVRYGRLVPRSWGFDAPGIMHSLPTTDRAISLTFDACGGPNGSGYDPTLIDFLRRRDIPATLFLNSRWVEANPAVFRKLAAEPLSLFQPAGAGGQLR